MALAAAVSLLGCAQARPSGPSGSSQAGLFAAARLENVLFPGGPAAETLFIARVGPDGKPESDQPISSSFAQGGVQYFPDLPAGRYVPVAAVFPMHGLRLVARVPSEYLRAAAVDVKPGRLAFLGALTFLRQGEGVGTFLLNAPRSLWFLLPPWRRASHTVPIRFVLDRSWEAETQALRQARSTLSQTLWSDTVAARVRELGDKPGTALKEKLLWGREVLPEQRADNFSYTDTLQWGPPRRAPQGLEWHEPKNRARIGVLLYSKGAPDYREPREVVRELKTFGSPEDSHSSFEVAVSSRPGVGVRYTVYHYPEPYLTGSVVMVSVTETDVIPVEAGHFLVQLRARQEDFDRFYGAFSDFRRQLRLERPPKDEVK